MSENKMSELIRASLDSIKNFSDAETFIGDAIETKSGVTVIPISRISIALATGGVDYTAKKWSLAQNFGGGSGSGITITPIAFLTIDTAGDTRLIPVDSAPSEHLLNRVLSLIEQAPELLQKIKNSLF